LLPDGSVNPGQMTSFNHYALGSVAAFLHHTVGGLSPLEPGWKKALIRPQPGGTLTSASTSFDSPYGLYAVSWTLLQEILSVKVTVPPNGQALVDLPGMHEEIGSGKHKFTCRWLADERWPPQGHPGPQSVLIPDNFVP
jgi:alpha-L-rhamnosidase